MQMKVEHEGGGKRKHKDKVESGGRILPSPLSEGSLRVSCIAT